jgi:DNA-binding MarR family transcriptional regulator
MSSLLKPQPDASEADQVWLMLVSMVFEGRGDWRRKVTEATGLPFSRVRALRRLVDKPLTMSELAEEMNTDAPAATVAVNDLEARDLVQRQPHPTNRRCKLVSLTAAGRRVVAAVRRVSDQAPAALQVLPAGELAEFKRILESIRHF